MLSLVAALAFSLQQPLIYRWVYVGTNLQVAENVDTLIALMKRAKAAGYNGLVITDTKLQRLALVPDWYFKNAQRLSDAFAAEHMDLIPGIFPVGYADGMLGNDPNLVEGQPVRNAPFVVRNGEAQLVPNPLEAFKNGDMEQMNANRL